MNALQFAAAALLAVPTGALAQHMEEVPLCTDRPTKANALCTVPAGNWQLESQVIGWSRTEVGAAETRTLALGSSLLKLGLSDRSDIELGFTPYLRTETRSAGLSSNVSGVGDVTLRYKRRLTAGDAPVQVGLIPFVKLPTADRDIGNGKVEGGLAAPIAISTGSPVALTLGPELDLFADGDGGGHHAALANLVNVSGPVADGVTLYGELWTMANFDPAGTVMLASADAAIAYLVSPRFQLDAGANLGLTKHTPDMELYFGLSLRF